MSLPIPVVRRKLRNGRIIERGGRGFSVNELREAGITIPAGEEARGIR
ncbi:MAG: hypothetical protein QXG25_06465 [Nitrososphaerota archaeon]